MTQANAPSFPFRPLPAVWLLRLALLAAGVVVLVLVFAWLQRKDVLPIRFVRIQGTFEHLDVAAVREVLLPQVNTGYLAVDLESVGSAVRALPWVDTVQIRRVWPDTLILDVTEQVPYVRWRDQGVLNRRGEAFYPPAGLGLFADLPVLEGPKGWQERLLQAFVRMQGGLAAAGLSVRALRVSDRLAWTVQLTDGIEVNMGRREPVTAFMRFVRTLPLFGEQWIHAIQQVDLRYPNGFAVRWKPGSEFRWKLFENHRHGDDKLGLVRDV